MEIRHKEDRKYTPKFSRAIIARLIKVYSIISPSYPACEEEAIGAW
jgi:hypothetical protein